MKTFTFISLLCLCAAQIDAQTEAITRIPQIDFPYRKGYHMHFTGKSVHDDPSQKNPVTGKPARVEENAEMMYYIVDEQYIDGDTIAMFDNVFIHGTDTIKDRVISPLICDADGMYFWFDSEKKKELKKSLGKNFAADINEEKVWTIRTPLFEGKKWESYNYDYTSKNPYLCISVDTTIQTGMGELQAFGIKSQSIAQEQKDYYVIVQFTDFYAQRTGKIQSIQETFVVIRQSGEWISIAREEMTLDKAWWDEGYFDN